MWDEKGYYYELRYWKNRFDTQLLKLFMTVMEQIVAAMEEEGQAAGLKNRLSPDLFPLHYRVEAGKVNEAAGCELIPEVDEGEQIKAYVLEKTGLKVSSLYIAQIKKKCGLDVGENFNPAKSENARQPQCTPEKKEA